MQIFYSTHTPSALQDPRFSAWREYLRRVGEGFAAGFGLVRELKDCAQCILHVELASILLKISDILHGIKLSTPNSQIKRNRFFFLFLSKYLWWAMVTFFSNWQGRNTIIFNILSRILQTFQRPFFSYIYRAAANFYCCLNVHRKIYLTWNVVSCYLLSKLKGT